MSTINIIKYYFYEGTVPRSQERIRQLINLAYQTARDRKIYPKAILIRQVEISRPLILCSLWGHPRFIRFDHILTKC